MANGLVQRPIKEIYEDWLDDTSIGTSATTAGVKWLNSSDGGTAFVIKDHATLGVVAQTVTAATDGHMSELSHRALAWYTSNGRIVMETRVQVSVGSIATSMLTVGFTDDQLEDSNALPVTLSGTTFTSNASTFVGVVFDSNATNLDAHAFYVDGDADASDAIAKLRFTGIAPVLSNWFGVRVVLNDNGSGNKARAEITVVDESTGRMAQKTFASTVTRSTPLVPHIAFQNHGAVAHTFNVDYIHAYMARN